MGTGKMPIPQELFFCGMGRRARPIIFARGLLNTRHDFELRRLFLVHPVEFLPNFLHQFIQPNSTHCGNKQNRITANFFKSAA
jgi:hypothetical protein